MQSDFVGLSNMRKEYIFFGVGLLVIVAMVIGVNTQNNRQQEVATQSMPANESSEELAKMEEYRIEREQADNAREKFRLALNYYYGRNGVVQNSAKASELFFASAELGAPFSPHYIVEILVNTYDKNISDRTHKNIKECYFWSLIAKTHSNLWYKDPYRARNTYGESHIGDRAAILSYQSNFEDRLSAHEIQEIQDRATNWWDTHPHQPW